MEIPKNLVIGDKNYTVKSDLMYVELFNNNIAGQINYYKQVIKIKSQKNKHEKESVFFHEIAHGILREMEFNYPKITIFRSNELFVDEFGLLLRKTFLDLLEKQKSCVELRECDLMIRCPNCNNKLKKLKGKHKLALQIDGDSRDD